MYERSYGYRYDEAKDATTTEIAKMIREDIKQAVKEGLLPGAPVRYSVTSESYSGGSSIDVVVKGFDARMVCDGGQKCHNVWCVARDDPAYAKGAETHMVFTPDAEVVKMTLERIHGAYNHDGSEIMTDYFDVRFYGGVTFEDPSTAAWRAEEKANLAAAKEAREQAAAQGDVRKVANHSRTGGTVVHAAVEVDGKLKFLCGAPTWRGGFRSFTDRDLTCSRCVKKVERVLA